MRLELDDPTELLPSQGPGGDYSPRASDRLHRQIQAAATAAAASGNADDKSINLSANPTAASKSGGNNSAPVTSLTLPVSLSRSNSSTYDAQCCNESLRRTINLQTRLNCMVFSALVNSSASSSSNNNNNSSTCNLYCIRADTVPAYVEMNRLLVRQYVSPDSRIAMSADVNSRSSVGPDSAIGEGSRVGERASVKKTIIGAHCQIGKNVRLANCILLDYVTVEDNVRLESCIVCSGAIIKEKSMLKDCEIGYKQTVGAGCKF
jgi:hypothetical protein